MGWRLNSYPQAPYPHAKLNKYKNKTLEVGRSARTLYKLPSLTEEGRRNQPHTPQPRSVV